MWIEIKTEADLANYNDIIVNIPTYKEHDIDRAKKVITERSARYFIYDGGTFNIVLSYYIKDGVLNVLNCMPCNDFEPEITACLIIKFFRDSLLENGINRLVAHHYATYDDVNIDTYLDYIHNLFWEIESVSVKTNGMIKLSVNRTPDVLKDSVVNNILGL